MGTSPSKKFPILDPVDFYKDFPKLNDQNHMPSSPATPRQEYPQRPYYVYNCFAYVVGDKTKFWWPGDCGYWPRDNSDDTLEELISLLAELGYEECADENFEKDTEKVAIFVKAGSPVHIAKQPSSRNGTWKSKMGFNVDMEHELRAIESDLYGKAEKFMRRRVRPAPKGGGN